VGNSGGGTLQFSIAILAQPIKLNQHFALSFRLNGAPGNPNTLYSFGPGQIDVLQLEQNTPSGHAAFAPGSIGPRSAVTGAFAQLGVRIKDDYIIHQIVYNCTNY
jgi:hypothetical protein